MSSGGFIPTDPFQGEQKVSPQERMINKGRYIYDKQKGRLVENKNYIPPQVRPFSPPRAKSTPQQKAWEGLVSGNVLRGSRKNLNFAKVPEKYNKKEEPKKAPEPVKKKRLKITEESTISQLKQFIKDKKLPIKTSQSKYHLLLSLNEYLPQSIISEESPIADLKEFIKVRGLDIKLSQSKTKLLEDLNQYIF